MPPLAVDACHAELVAKGVPIIGEPTDLPAWRHRTLFFAIHALAASEKQDVDARDKRGHDES